MAAVSESSLVKAQVKAQPPSPTTKSHQQQQNEKQLHNLLQQTSSVHQNGSNLIKSPKSGHNGVPAYHFLQQHLQHLASENMPPLPIKGSPNGKGHNSRTKGGMLSASDHVIQSNVEVKLEGSSKAVMSPQSNSSSSSRQDDKKMNNNSVSYTAGGRLKFFKGKILPKWLFMLFKNIAYSYCLFFGDKKEACVEQKQHKHACHFDLFE